MTFWIIFLFVAMFGLGVLYGAPYLPILSRESKAFFELADLKPGQTLVDLGSGDGRLLRSAAKAGIRGIGYEINPIMYLISIIVCWRYRRLVSIRLANFWHQPLPRADVIYVFLIERYMGRLDAKLMREITEPTTVVSHVFEIPGRTIVDRRSTSLLYQYPALDKQAENV